MAAKGISSADMSSPINDIDNEDGDDPHDLALSSRHAPRASMMDNMVMDLDQFSFGQGDSPYDDIDLRHDHDYNAISRQRGHTFSSSVSSTSDIRDLKPDISASQSTPRPARPNSSKYGKSIQRLPSIFGEDEDSARAVVYDAQRAAQPAKKSGRVYARKAATSKDSSGSSSIDLGDLAAISGRLGAAGNRRSRSFDFGSRQRKEPRLIRNHTDEPLPTEPGPAMEVDVQNGPNSAPQAPPMVRKNSAKSAKSAYARKGIASSVGTSAMRTRTQDFPSALPSMRSSSALNNFLSEHRSSFHASFENHATPRPGFFRRVFGASRHTANLSENPPLQNVNRPNLPQESKGQQTKLAERPVTPPLRSQKSVATVSSDIPANKENQPIVTKKSSTFFRRRKKSIANLIPPPMPLTLNSNTQADVVRGEISPVSSLRAFMDPYLSDNGMSGLSGGHRRVGSTGFHKHNDGSPVRSSAKGGTQQSENSRGNGSESTRERELRTKGMTLLRIPHQDSFLADTSSAEEPVKPSPFRDSPVRPRLDRGHSSVEDDSRENIPKLGSSTSLTSSAATPTTLRPGVSTREQSWQSDSSPLRISAAARALNSPQTMDDKAKAHAAGDGPCRESGATPRMSESDVSDYRSAPSTPTVLDVSETETKRSLFVHVSHPSASMGADELDRETARKILDNPDQDMDGMSPGAWLGETGTQRERVRKLYMELFDWSGHNILVALRGLCDRIALKGETQQVDRLLDAFARRWCDCNTRHGFRSCGKSQRTNPEMILRSADIVHTICYSLLLLNTDLHLADIGHKMTRTQFVRNAMPTLRRHAHEANGNNNLTPSAERPFTFHSEEAARRPSVDQDTPTALPNYRPVDRLAREDSADYDGIHGKSGPLVDAPFIGTEKGWEEKIEEVLKAFYTSISRQPLPLYGSQADHNPAMQQSGNFLSLTGNMLRRTPSTLSKAQSDTYRGRLGADSRSLGTRWPGKARSRPRLSQAVGMGSSRTSLDEQSSGWSPSISSTWSKASLGKTLTSMSVESFGTEHTHGDYQSSIGFANALSQAIIRDDQLEVPVDEGVKAAPLLEDESLELDGAPWAKEGILKHKCHLEGVDKRSKDRNWNDCFAVIEKGWMRLFSFSMTAKSLRNKARNRTPGGVVGGGNWQDSAEEVWKLALRHTIASSLPPPGYSKQRPYVWALSLPTGAVHLFSVGTPDIVKEFVTTANFWSARLSKEPMMGGVSNMEYGWSDGVVNQALTSGADTFNGIANRRPSTQMSMRSSFDHSGNAFRPKLPGDKTHINDWSPPQQSMFASQLLEVDQLKALQAYVHNVEEELQKHNELRGSMSLAFTPRLANTAKAMNNWEKKSSYLLREIVKFRTYIDALQAAQGTKEKIYKMRREEEEAKREEDDSRALGGSTVMR